MIALPRIVGHRGAAALAPENTLAGFRAAAAAGAGWVELDVRLAADGLVVFHDATLERTTNGAGTVLATPLDDLMRLDAAGPFGASHAGERIPTLAEALAEIERLGLGVNVEVKTDEQEPSALVAAVVATVAETWTGGTDRLLYSSFSRAAVWALREAAPAAPRGLIAGRLPDDWKDVLADLGCVSAHLGWRHLRAEQVRAVKAEGYAVAVWTVNDRATAERLRHWGADAIITDDPATMRGLD